MKIRKWEEIPDFMRIPEVRPYYDALKKKRVSLIVKRMFDIVSSGILLMVLSPVFVVLAVAIKIDSPGPVFYRQERVTQYGRIFRIHKFRTMVNHADKIGSAVTVSGDSRITSTGAFLRKYRLDEIGQLIDVLVGDMTFVGTRPEVKKYVDQYKPVMRATLLLPAGVTSEASIRYKDEAELLIAAKDVNRVYVERVLPEKMKYNLEYVRKFSFRKDIQTMVKTVVAVIR